MSTTPPHRAERPAFEEIYMGFALSVSRRSTCARLNVGTVITTADYRRVLAIGYNGNATGLTNACDRAEPGNCGCLHSEENALIHLDSPREPKKIVFVTHLPCPLCAKRLVNAGGISKVYYANDYRVRTAAELLDQAGIQVVHYPAESVPNRLAQVSPSGA